jgi:fido (protein-threonine AMPylation protein)
MTVSQNPQTARRLADSAARYSNDECAIRFGYRLVVIHPFPNGNGRWSRLASDALIVALGGPRFTWEELPWLNRGPCAGTTSRPFRPRTATATSSLC